MNKIVLTILALAAVSVIFLLVPDDALALQSGVKECGTAESNHRFSCYRAALEGYYSGFDGGLGDLILSIEELDLEFQDDDKSYAIFGTNCHTFYHALGDFAATHADLDDLERLYEERSRKCTSGYMMGLFKRYALRNGFESSYLAHIYEVCHRDQKRSCAHEIGHLLHDKYNGSVLEILDRISASEYDAEYPEEYAYRVFDEIDLKMPFEECDAILKNENDVRQCYTGVGHNLFLYLEFNPRGYAGELEKCMTLGEPKVRDKCFSFLIYRIGINDVAPKFLSGDFDLGNQSCSEAVSLIKRPDLLAHCYVGAGGGIGLYAESEFDLIDKGEKEIELFRKELSRNMGLCEMSHNEYVVHCFKGLLGTDFKNLYRYLELEHPVIEGLLPELDDFQVTG